MYFQGLRWVWRNSFHSTAGQWRPSSSLWFSFFLFSAFQEQCSMCRMFNWLATCSKRSEVSSLSLLAALWVGWWRTFFLYKLFYAVEAQPPREFPLSRMILCSFPCVEIQSFEVYCKISLPDSFTSWSILKDEIMFGWISVLPIHHTIKQSEGTQNLFGIFFNFKFFFTQWTSYGLLLGQLKWKLHRIKI